MAVCEINISRAEINTAICGFNFARTGLNITICDINIAGAETNMAPAAANPENASHQFVAEGKKQAITRSAGKTTVSGN